MPQYFAIRDKAFRHHAAQLKKRFGAAYDSKAAGVAIRGRMGRIDADIAATADARARLSADHAPRSLMTQARFGRGRERTKA